MCIYTSSYDYMCLHTTAILVHLRIRVLILAHMCLDTTADSRAGGSAGKKKHCTTCIDYIRVRILHVCPHTTIYVSSYYYIRVLMLLDTTGSRASNGGRHTDEENRDRQHERPQAARARAHLHRGAHFTCFTSTKVQILRRGRGRTYTALRKFTCFDSTKSANTD